MSQAQGTTTPGRPWHLQAIGILGCLWGVMSAGSFLLTQLDVEAVMSRFPPEQRAYFASWPLWADGSWALGVASGVIGCLLLLRRNRRAVPALLASLVGWIVANLGGLVLLDGMAVMAATGGLGPTAVPVVIAVFLAAYARAMRTRGVLR